MRTRGRATTGCYQQAFAPARICFDADSDALRFDAALFSRTLPSADPELKKVLMCHAEQTVAGVVTGDPLAPRVRKLLLKLIPSGDGDAKRVAGTLGMSRRILSRRLNEEGASFKGLLEESRHQLALQYLEQTQLDSQEIAARLGYSVTTAFSRAFGRWEGKTPLAHRRWYREHRANAGAGLSERAG